MKKAPAPINASPPTTPTTIPPIAPPERPLSLLGAGVLDVSVGAGAVDEGASVMEEEDASVADVEDCEVVVGKMRSRLKV
jgi:hypothetical protein